MERNKTPKNSGEDTAAAEQVTTTAEQPANGEPEGEDYAGYENLDEMRKAIYEGRKEGKRLHEQNVQLAGYLARLLKGTEQESKAAADEIGELGIPADTLRRAIREVVHEEMAPQARVSEALNTMRAAHPEFAKSEPDFNRWLTANPDVVANYNTAVAESPRAAETLLRGVFAEYQMTRRPAPAAEPKKVAPGAKIPATRGGGSVAREPADKMSREELKELLGRARRTGSPVELMRAILDGKPIHRDLAPKGN